MSSKRKPNPQRWQAAAWSSRPSRPSLSIDRFWQFGQMKYGTWRSGLDARRGERVVQVSLFGRQEALGVERAHAAGPGRGDGLAVCVILDVADREHAGDVRLRRARLRDQITGVVVLELVQEQRRVRVVADRDEQSVGREVAHLSRLDVLEPHAAELAFLDAEHVDDDIGREELDLLVGTGAVGHDLRRAELAAAVDDRHLRREARQEERLLHRRVPATDDHDLAVAVERAVAGRAVRDTASLQRNLGLQPELPRAGAGRDDHRASLVLVVADPDAEGTLGEVDLGHVVGDELRPELLGLPAELHHHLRAEDPLGVSGVVLDVARDHELAAPLEALDHEGLQVGTGGIERRRVPGGPAADDDQVTDFHLQYSTVPTGWVFHGPGDYNRAAPGRPLSWPSS